MTNGTRGTGRARARIPRRAAGLAALVVGLAVLIVFPSASLAGTPATVWGESPASWTNGMVLCEFAATSPSVGVSALARPSTGLTVTVVALEELSPSGAVVSWATLPTSSWTVTNRSTDDAYDLSYATSANVTSAAARVGTVELRVDFVLPVYTEGPASTLDAVQVEIGVSAWPWTAATDHLALSISAQPSFPAAERLAFGGALGTVVQGVSTSTGATWEELSSNSTANVTAASGSPAVVGATPTITGTAAAANVNVTFGAGAGAFSALAYTAQVQVVFPTTIAGIPTIDLVAVGGAAALVSVLIAAGTRRLRRHPSGLTYVEEEP